MKRRNYSTPPDSATDVESAADAYRMGCEARHGHAKRDQWPGRWRDQINIEQWLMGWDDANAAIMIEQAAEKE